MNPRMIMFLGTVIVTVLIGEVLGFALFREWNAIPAAVPLMVLGMVLGTINVCTQAQFKN